MFGNPVYSEIIDSALESAEFPSSPENLYAPVRYILSLAGKRIRPQLVFLGADIFGHTDVASLLPASKAIEYFHNFSLIHDDIMDKAPLRRGKPTVHKRWNDNIAILSGDALLVKAYEELANCPIEVVPSLLKAFNKVALEVCEGQQLDMDFEERNNVSEEEYIDMIRLKTSVLLGGALEIGAIIAKATFENTHYIYNFGVNLGIAFQLQDDILDAFGDPHSFGKQVGGDIIVNKKTILHILLKKSLLEADVDSFNAIMSMKSDVSSQKVEGMLGLYDKYDILKAANSLKEYYTAQAYTNLKQIDVPEGSKSQLFDLADKLMYRSR
ncbi:polyprenyl synthetase family protein [Sphingobacterium rhinopitheci]|uniref:polyprenyl synthetase family protein n=1 Tax=Sphingobacterium rhinopitheci TaxID=2781960 RepID=UPI001F51C3E6|nr:polyprenyl synthetase family protein [Sphingobacterium rhinopitheci]MCI0921627.1 polyprenyl synthetase family protein [Sphingobacterium rhinopitheci]